MSKRPSFRISRREKVPIPKEHGAWALVYGPLATATLAAGALNLRFLLLTVAATALFLSHEPLSRMARSASQSIDKNRLAHWRMWSGVYLGIGGVAGVALVPLYQLWSLIWMGAGVAFLLGVHLYLVSRRVERSIPSELLAVAGLTATLPIGWYVFRSELGSKALLLWMLCILFFSSGIFFVKMTVSRHVGRPEAAQRKRDCAIYHGLLPPFSAALGYLAGAPLAAIVATLPVAVRAFAGIFFPPEVLSLKKIGYREVVYTVFFVVVAGLGFR